MSIGVLRVPRSSCRPLCTPISRSIQPKFPSQMLKMRAGEASDSSAGDVRAVAELIADSFISSNMTVGLGTGVAVNEVIREVSERLADGRLQGVQCVPSSDVSASECAFHGVPQTEPTAAIDLVVDVADAVDAQSGADACVTYIVGRGRNGPQTGQPSLPRLRELLEAATGRVVVVAETHEACTASRLQGDVPVLIEGTEDWEEVGEELDDAFLGDAEVRRRSFDPVANPRGGNSPVLTPEGHMVIDIQFYDGLKYLGEDRPYSEIAAEIEGIPGVVTHGLVVGAARAVVRPGRNGRLPEVLVPTPAQGAETPAQAAEQQQQQQQ